MKLKIFSLIVFRFQSGTDERQTTIRVCYNALTQRKYHYQTEIHFTVSLGKFKYLQTIQQLS